MPQMKVFTLGVNGFIGPDIGDALGLAGVERPATILIVAPSKAAGARLPQASRFRVNVRDPEYGAVGGHRIDVLRAAGLFDAPGVVVIHNRTGIVVRIDDSGSPVKLGRLVWEFVGGYTFVAERK